MKWQSFGSFDRRAVRSRRITWAEREELHAAALDCRAGAKRTSRIDVSLGVAVVAGIGIDQDPPRSAFLSVQDLEATEIAAVAGQHDLVAHRNSQLVERGEIVGPRVVGIDDLSG